MQNHVQRRCCDLQLGSTITVPGALDKPGRIVKMEITEAEDIKLNLYIKEAEPGLQDHVIALPWFYLVNDHTTQPALT